jgi:hypothetical protein
MKAVKDYPDGSPERTWAKVATAWIREDVGTLVSLVQPSWAAGVATAPYEQIAQISAWAEHNGQRPLPTSGVMPSDAIRRIRTAIREGRVGSAKAEILSLVTSTPLVEVGEPEVLVLDGLKPEFIVDVRTTAKFLGTAREAAVGVWTMRIIREQGSWSWNPISARRFRRESGVVRV